MYVQIYSNIVFLLLISLETKNIFHYGILGCLVGLVPNGKSCIGAIISNAHLNPISPKPLPSDKNS